jgi:hypothetical protein
MQQQIGRSRDAGEQQESDCDCECELQWRGPSSPPVCGTADDVVPVGRDVLLRDEAIESDRELRQKVE